MTDAARPLTEPEPSAPTAASRLGAVLLRLGIVAALAALYRRHERYTPVLFFFGGVGWDLGTLKRIDALYDNLFLLGYLLLLGALLIVATLVEHGKVQNAWLVKRREWFPAAIQFFLGALFSAYVIYYSRSASLTETSFFLLLLVALLVGNEFMHRKMASLYLLLGLYFLATSSFFIFFIPVVTRTMGYGTFLAGCLVSAGVVAGMIHFLNKKGVFRQPRELATAGAVVLGLFGVLNLFYVQNWIPPVPLALQHGGIYHAVAHEGPTYTLTYQKPAWYKFWVDSDETFRRTEGEAVYCFAAIFAPTQLRTQVYHQWSRYNEATGEWVRTDRIGYHVTGGRDRGFRGHTRKRNVQPGRWRVDVQTEDGRTLGRIPFTVVPANDAPPVMTTLVYE